MRAVKSPDGHHTAEWRGGGELWMSGPEWGFLQVDALPELRGATSEFLWASSSEYLAVVVLYIQDVPTRQGVEGIGYRVAVVQPRTGIVRYTLGNVGLAQVSVVSFTGLQLSLLVNGEQRQIDVSKMGFQSSGA